MYTLQNFDGEKAEGSCQPGEYLHSRATGCMMIECVLPPLIESSRTILEDRLDWFIGVEQLLTGLMVVFWFARCRWLGI